MNKLILGLLFFLTSCTLNSPVEGQKTGRIIKIANEGLFCTTCEGELIRGGFNDGTGAMGSVFKFTIKDQRLKEIAYKAFETQSEVILSYERSAINAIWASECHSPHFVTHIKIKD